MDNVIAVSVALVAGSLGVLALVGWVCHRDAPGLLQHYEELGGDDLQPPR